MLNGTTFIGIIIFILELGFSIFLLCG